MKNKLSIKDTRKNLSEIVERVSVGNEVFIITKFGKEKVAVVPINRADTNFEEAKRKSALKGTFGSWEKRNDIASVKAFSKKLRKRLSSRYGKIFD